MSISKLHFVYNVELTPQAIVKDFLHRITDPATYPCRLCDLTYGRFAKKVSWQLFVWSLPVTSAFYTKDEFVRKFPGCPAVAFPVVLAEDNHGRMDTFLSADQLASMRSLDALRDTVTARLKGKATGV